MAYKIDKHGSMYRVFNSFAVKDQLKAAGFRWEPLYKVWYTQDKDALINCGVEFTSTDSDLISDLKSHSKEMQHRVDHSVSMDEDFAVQCGSFDVDYRGYQVAGIKYALDTKERGLRGCIIGDDMGIGKTVQGIGVLNHMLQSGRVDCVIVCPASVKFAWADHLLQWACGIGEVTVALNGKGKAKTFKFSNEGFGNSSILVINYELLAKDAWQDLISAMQVQLVICDEAHKIKNATTQRSKAVLALDGFRLFLTGTPIPNRVRDIYTIVDACDSNMFRNKTQFLYRYCGASNTTYGTEFNGASNTEELAIKLRANCMIRRLKSQVLTELPAKQYETIQLNEVEIEECAEQFDIDFEDWGRVIEAKYISTLRRRLAMRKIAGAIEYIKDQIETHPVVVFAHHREVIKALHQAFEHRAVLVDGSVSAEDRQKAVEKFQHAEADVFIGSIKACAEGLTLTQSSHVVFVECDWVPSSMLQAEDRCHRIGQTDSVLITMLTANGIDRRITNIIQSKMREIEAVVDADVRVNATVQINKVEEPIENLEDSVSTSNFNVESQACVEAEQKQKDARFESKYSMTRKKAEAVWEACKVVANMCDGAFERDGDGFNGRDTGFGTSIARQPYFPTIKQINALERMLKKYKRQIPIDLYQIIYG